MNYNYKHRVHKTWTWQQGGDKLVHENLKQLREQNNLTQVQMTKLLGLKYKSHYNQIENGKIAMSLEMARKIADIFNKSVDEIFFEKKVHVTRTSSIAW